MELTGVIETKLGQVQTTISEFMQEILTLKWTCSNTERKETRVTTKMSVLSSTTVCIWTRVSDNYVVLDLSRSSPIA